MMSLGCGTRSHEDRFGLLKAIIRELPKVQRAMLDRLSCGDDIGVPARVAKALVARGLIVPHQRSSRDRFGVMTWTVYEVPIVVHMAWAEVGSEEFDALSPEEQAAAEAPDA